MEPRFLGGAERRVRWLVAAPVYAVFVGSVRKPPCDLSVTSLFSIIEGVSVFVSRCSCGKRYFGSVVAGVGFGLNVMPLGSLNSY